MIGIFDSGLGGLTVARQIISAYPYEDIYYLADTLAAPYGDKTADSVVEIAVQNVQYLISQGAGLIVIACNTATAAGLAYVTAQFSGIPIIGVIEPTARAALAMTRNNRIGVLATALTVHSEAYLRSLEHSAHMVTGEIQITQVAAPLFVPLIDKGITRGKRLYNLAQQYCANLIAAHVDTVILGCTHYPLVSSILGDILGDEVRLVNGSRATAQALHGIYSPRYFPQTHYENDQNLSPKVKYQFVNNSDMSNFAMMCRRFLSQYADDWPGEMVFPAYRPMQCPVL